MAGAERDDNARRVKRGSRDIWTVHNRMTGGINPKSCSSCSPTALIVCVLSAIDLITTVEASFPWDNSPTVHITAARSRMESEGDRCTIDRPDIRTLNSRALRPLHGPALV
jgi:hypothetical protein